MQTGHLDTTLRKHGVFRDALASQVGRVGRVSTNLSSWSLEYVHLESRYTTLTTEGISNGDAVAGVLQLLESEAHVLDPPACWLNDENPNACIVCEEPLETDTANLHVWSCIKKRDEGETEAAWQAYLESLPTECNWVSTVASRACKTDVSVLSPQELQVHFFKHSKSPGHKCFRDGCKETFDTREELNTHTWTTHGILLFTSSSCLSFWCDFRKKTVFINKASPARQAHFRKHFDDAQRIIIEYGYSGTKFADNVTVPGFCIFCVHNRSLSPEERLQVFTYRDLPRHLHSHVRHMAQDARIVCPGVTGDTCRYATPTSLEMLWQHLEKVHYGIVFSEKLGPRKEGRASRRKEGTKYGIPGQKKQYANSKFASGTVLEDEEKMEAPNDANSGHEYDDLSDHALEELDRDILANAVRKRPASWQPPVEGMKKIRAFAANNAS